MSVTKLRKLGFVFLSAFIIMIILFKSGLFYSEEIYIKEKVYTTADPYYLETDGEFTDHIELEDDIYYLREVKHTVLKKSPAVKKYTYKPFIITSPAFIDGEENHIPDDIIEISGESYQLKTYTIIPALYGKKMQELTGIIHYSDVEQKDNIPPEADIMMVDEVTKEQKAVSMPLISYELSSYHWVDGFELPVQVQGYDADFYILGDIIFSRNEKEPLKGYENQLMNYLGLSPAYYQIHSVEWESDVYESKGIQYRNAVVKGQKLVAECDAYYGGLIALEQQDGHAVRSEYVKVTPDYRTEYKVQATAEYVKIRSRWWD